MKDAQQNTEWPFDEPKNVATVTVRQIIRESQPILLVSHTWMMVRGSFSLGANFPRRMLCLSRWMRLYSIIRVRVS